MRPQKILEYIKTKFPEESEVFFKGVEEAVKAATLTYKQQKQLKKKPKRDPKQVKQEYYQRTFKSRKVTIEKLCVTCKELFSTWRQDKKYCCSECSPSYRERRRLSKRKGHIDAKPKWMPWSRISEVYESKPEGTQIDHIIPLHHPDVCGLHVPWNLQYLTPEENAMKSNRWDGTYDNLGWKKSY